MYRHNLMCHTSSGGPEVSSHIFIAHTDIKYFALEKKKIYFTGPRKFCQCITSNNTLHIYHVIQQHAILPPPPGIPQKFGVMD